MLWKSFGVFAGVLAILVVMATGATVSRRAAENWQEEDSDGVYTHDLLDKVLADAANETGMGDRSRTFTFGRNGVLEHENVVDNRDGEHGKMEMLLALFDERREFLKQLRERNGNSSADLDPNDELEVRYQKLKEELMAEYNGTIFDPDVEYAKNVIVNETSSLNRGKRYNWGGYWAQWPKAIIPYVYEAGDLQGIRDAMDRYEDLTCMRFVPHTDASVNEELGLGHPGYLKFLDINNCWSYVGNHRWADGQGLSCCSSWRCVHELGHSMGMMHEQNNYLRDGWMRVNWNNINSGYEGVYVRGEEGAHFTLGYDMTSYMHYRPQDYSKGGGYPVMSSLIPGMTFNGQDFYMFKEISDVQQCAQTEACEGFTTECENDGYVTVIRGKCMCRCPVGLDPESGCTKPLTKLPSDLKMPRGQYALFKPKTGCPEDGSGYKDGKVIHYGEGNNYHGSDVLDGEITKTRAEHHFCVHDDADFNGKVDGFFLEKSTWPIGKYCILRKGGKCPIGMRSGHVKYGDKPPTEETENSQDGELPDGTFDEDTRLEFCCQDNGETWEPILMPESKPFILFPHSAKECQRVLGMQYKREMFGIDSMDDKGYEVEGLMGYFDVDFNKYLNLEYCYYTPSDMNCGETITLTSDNPEAVIEMDGTGRTDLECTWLVKGENSEGSVVLNFEEFDISLDEPLEIRHVRIGQKGFLYRGKHDKRSIKSVLDKMLIQFKTRGQSSSKAKARVRWVPNSEMCYSVAKKGVHYSGQVNYTNLLEPCIPWTQATSCPNNPWTAGNEFDNLEGNACRNPDNSLGPWCYTDLNGCKRSYCDVCRTEALFDRSDDCVEKKGNGFCTKNQADALRNCGKTCSDQLPNMGPMEKMNEIQCNQPTAPVDGVFVGEEKSRYDFGEEVAFKCKDGGRSLKKTCQSNGDWSRLGSVCNECPFGSVIRENSCYLFINRDMNYVQAKKECNQIGGEAAMPNTPEENKFIVNNVADNRTVWIGVTDKATEGTWVLEDGTEAEWKNFGDSEPNNWNNEEHCASLAKDLTWSDRVCDYDAHWAKMPVVCEVPRVTALVCADFLEEERCIQLLTEKTTMCKDYPSFAEEYCAKTCGKCGAEDLSCFVEPPAEFVKVLSDKVSLSVAENIEYACKPGMVKVKGDEHRACMPNGELTGEALSCNDPSKMLVFETVGTKSLSKGDYALPDKIVYTGENALLTIKVKGEVYAWEFYSNSPSINAFQVWRVITPGSQYELIGQTVINTGNDQEERHELPEGKRIPVEPGDLIAIWKADRGGVGFSRCSPVEHPTWPGTSWNRKGTSADEFKTGDVESFNTGSGCAVLAMRAIISVEQ